MNSTVHSLLIISVAAFVTIITRFSPFILFNRGKELPRWIKYLGNMLPPAVMSVLLIYCIRSVDLTAGSHGIPELLGISAAVLLHIWKGNTLISIGVSTVLYMILVQAVF